MIKTDVKTIVRPAGVCLKAFLDMSTAHMSPEDNALLGRAHSNQLSEYEETLYLSVSISVEMVDQGWIVFVFEEFGYKDRERLLKLGFSLAFVDILDIARMPDIKGVWFDAYAPEVDGLHVFDWNEKKEDE